MIVLRILLYILLAVFGIILLLFVLPVKAEASFIDGRFRYKAGFSFITLTDSGGGGVLGWLKKRRRNKNPDKNDDEDWDIPDDYLNAADDDDDEPVSMPESSESMHFTEEDTAPDNDDSSGSDVVSEVKPPVHKPEKKKRHRKEKTQKEPKTLGEKVEFLLDLWRAADRPLLKIFKGFNFYDVYIDFIIANEDAYKCALNYGRISGLVYNLLGAMSTLFTVRLQTVDVNAGFGLKENRWDAALKLRFRLGTMVIAGVWFLITYIFRYFIPNMMQQMKLKKTAARQK